MDPRSLFWCVLVAALPASATASVLPARADVAFSPFDLAAQAIPLGADHDGVELHDAQVALLLGAPQPVPDCALTLSDGALSGPCPFLWAMERPADVDLALSRDGEQHVVRLVRGWTGGSQPARLDAATREIVLPAGFEADEAVILQVADGAPVGWVAADLVDGRVPLDADTFRYAAALGGRYALYARGDAGVLAYQVLAGAPTSTPTPVTPTPTTAPAATTVAVETSDPSDPNNRSKWKVTAPRDLACPPKELPHEDMIVVCVDATGDVLKYRLLPAGTRLTKPNRYFYVHVLHFVDRRIDINLGGQIGTWVPGNRGDVQVRSSGGGRGGGVGGAQGVKPPDLTISTQTLAPRQPGYAPLTIKATDLAGEDVGSPLLVEFWIDETYSGAFRMGVAGVFLGGIEQTYQRVTRPNSQQAEIQASGRNPVDVDLVVGYAPYLDAGGRSASGCESAPACFSPYFGLGLVSASSEGSLEFFKSVHLGFEWELTPTFSVALTANLRRVERLAEGFAPGQPLDGEIPTESRYVFGAGVVINLSPSFLKIGARGATALLQ